MADLISREGAIEEIARRDTTNGTVKVYSGLDVNAILGDLPAVDAVPVVHARWIETTIPANTTGHGGIGQDKKKGELCSACRCAFDAKMLWCDNYCPNCGARMDEEAR